MIIQKDKNSCIVICRGNSVKRLKEIDDIKYDKCFLVNEWSKEVSQHKEIREFLEKQANLIHVINRDSKSLFTKKDYLDLKFNEVLLNVRKPEYLSSNLKKHLDKINQKSSFLNENLVPISKTKAGGFPSTGILATVNAAMNGNVKNIYVIGLDFFEDRYFSHHSHSMKPEVFDYQKKKGVIMKEYLTNIIKHFNDKNFIFCTNSSFNPNLENCKIL
jgi:hypothetical protein